MYTQYGGEFVAACRALGLKLLEEVYAVYNEMMARGFVTTKGDEFILCVSANRLRNIVKNASAYVCRYWTSPDFRLVSTNYQYNAVVVLHLPAEKQRGLMTIFQKYVAKNLMPSKKSIWRICRLNRQPLFDRFKYRIKQANSIRFSEWRKKI